MSLLADLRRLLAAATSAPWERVHWDGTEVQIAGGARDYHPGYDEPGTLVATFSDGWEVKHAEPNAALACALRSAAPALVDVAQAALDYCEAVREGTDRAAAMWELERACDVLREGGAEIPFATVLATGKEKPRNS
jgi:hypothetical protein